MTKEEIQKILDQFSKDGEIDAEGAAEAIAEALDSTDTSNDDAAPQSNSQDKSENTTSDKESTKDLTLEEIVNLSDDQIADRKDEISAVLSKASAEDINKYWDKLKNVITKVGK